MTAPLSTAPSFLLDVSLLRNVRPWGGQLSDIHISDGLITNIVPAIGSASHESGAVDGQGGIALPSFTNAHAHLDKTWWGLPWQPNPGKPTVAGRIDWERERRGDLGIPNAKSSALVLENMVRSGTTRVRTHIDVDVQIGLRGIEVVNEAIAPFENAIQVEMVAFPQDGLLRRPGTLNLLEAALKHGCHYVGSIDPASLDRDPVAHLDAIFQLATDCGVGVDVHLHDPGELGAFQIELIVDYTERLNMAGRVTISHAFAISQVGRTRRSDLLQAMSATGVALATVAPLKAIQLPLHEIVDAGVRLGFGTDGIRDLWSPYGTGDMLGIAWQFARASNLNADADIMKVLKMVTVEGSYFVGSGDTDLQEGSRADIVVIDALNPMDALARIAPRVLAIGNGRLLFGPQSSPG